MINKYYKIDDKLFRVCKYNFPDDIYKKSNHKYHYENTYRYHYLEYRKKWTWLWSSPLENKIFKKHSNNGEITKEQMNIEIDKLKMMEELKK